MTCPNYAEIGYCKIGYCPYCFPLLSTFNIINVLSNCNNQTQYKIQIKKRVIIIITKYAFAERILDNIKTSILVITKNVYVKNINHVCIFYVFTCNFNTKNCFYVTCTFINLIFPTFEKLKNITIIYI